MRRLLKPAAIKVKSRGRLKLSEHEEDNRIYECALAAKAHYIVTENTRHFTTSYKYTKIVNARQLLRLLHAHQGRLHKTHCVLAKFPMLKLSRCAFRS